MIHHMDRARLIYRDKLIEGRDGQRIVGYDNEAGKGDHCHRGDRESPYSFTTVEKLIADFISDVERARGEIL